MGYCLVLNCDKVQAVLSARLDGEAYDLSDDVIDLHLSECEECTRFYEQAAIVNRQLTFRENDMMPKAPDLSAAILAGVEPEFSRQASRRALSRSLVRIVLTVMGLVWGFAAIRLLQDSSAVAAAGDADVLAYDPAHMRLLYEGAAMRCALGFGLLFTAWQPRVAGGVVPIFGALWMFSFGFGIRDIVVDGFQLDAVTHLALLLVSFVAVVWAWVATKGFVMIEQVIRELKSNPS